MVNRAYYLIKSVTESLISRKKIELYCRFVLCLLRLLKLMGFEGYFEHFYQAY